MDKIFVFGVIANLVLMYLIMFGKMFYSMTTGKNQFQSWFFIYALISMGLFFLTAILLGFGVVRCLRCE